MRLYDEIFKNVDGVAGARCIIVPHGGGYFEGVKSVVEFSETKLVLAFPRQTVEIEGDKFCIKKYCDGDLHLSGEILSVRAVLPPKEGRSPLQKERREDA